MSESKSMQAKFSGLAQFSAAKPDPGTVAEAGAHAFHPLLPIGTTKCMDLTSMAPSNPEICVIDVGPGHKRLIDILRESLPAELQKNVQHIYFPNAIS